MEDILDAFLGLAFITGFIAFVAGTILTFAYLLN